MERGYVTADQVSKTIKDAISLLATLEELVTEPPSRGSADLRHATHVGSSPSWHQQAAYLVLEIANKARMVESALRLAAGLPDHPRGSSAHNTIQALNALPGLSVAAPQDQVAAGCSVLYRWISRAAVVVGEVEPMRHLPRAPGGQEPRCPWCRFMTLRQQAYAGIVRCINPACRDQDGHRVIGRVEIGRFTAEPVVVWQDDTMGLALGETDA